MIKIRRVEQFGDGGYILQISQRLLNTAEIMGIYGGKRAQNPNIAVAAGLLPIGFDKKADKIGQKIF